MNIAVKKGKQLSEKSIQELLLMNIQASASEAKDVLKQLEAKTGRPLGPNGLKVFASLTKIAETAFYATGHNRGCRDFGGNFNANLLELLGEGKLN